MPDPLPTPTIAEQKACGCIRLVRQRDTCFLRCEGCNAIWSSELELPAPELEGAAP